MRKILLAGVGVAMCMGAAYFAGRASVTGDAPPYSPLVAYLSDGGTLPLPDDENEDVWYTSAQSIADERGESVAVLQGDRLVALIQPTK